MRIRIILVLALVLPASLPYAGQPALAVTSGCAPETGTTVFVSNCISAPDNDAVYTDLKARVEDVISSTASGRSIRIAMFSWDDTRLDLALLLKTASATIPVKVISESGSVSSEVRTALQGILEECPNGCMSGSADAINHNKIALLSKGSQRTAIQMSLNLTDVQKRKYNNSVTVRTTTSGDPTIYNWYDAYFQRLDAQSWSGWTDTSGKTAFSSTGGHYMRTYAFPRAATADPVLTILNNVQCTSTHKTVWVAMSKFRKRDALIDALDNLEDDDDGTGSDVACDVRVLLQDNQDHYCTEVDGPGYNLANGRVAHNGAIHHKFIAIDAKFDGTLRNLVFVGSHNLTGDGLTKNDEVMLRVAGTTYASFRAHFSSLWSDGGTVLNSTTPSDGCPWRS